MINKLVTLAICLSFTMAACPNDEYCLACEGAKCTACQDSYPDADGVCKVPGTLIDDCRAYKDKDTCESCDYEYELKDNKCEKIGDGCALKIEDITGCAVCTDGIVAEAGECKDKKCSVDNCARCLLSFCIECNSGYAVSGATSLCIKEPVNNCWMTGADVSKCSLCRPGYYDTDTECKKSSKTTTLSSSSIIYTFVILITGMIYA